MKLKAILVSAGCGAAAALAFPKFHFSFLSWIALIPLLLLIFKNRPPRALLLGWIAGFSFYAVLLYWIPAVPEHYGGLSPLFSLLIYIAFVLFLGLFWALFAWSASIIKHAFPRWGFFAAPLLWVAMEYTVTHFLTGFPWGILGSSQYQNLIFIQSAAVAGVYGLSFLLVFFQSMFLYSLHSRLKSPFFSALALIIVIHAAGFLILKDYSREKTSIAAAVIQGNVTAETDFSISGIDQTEELFQRHLDLSRQAVSQGARLIIWPELSIPLCFTCNFSIYPEYQARLREFSTQNQISFLLGTNEYEAGMGENLFYNTSTCLAPDGSLSFYSKNHLVPFGEYTPYKKVFSFIANFTHSIGELTPGKSTSLHEFNAIPFGTPICFEIIFPEEVRKFVKLGAQFLVTITNDGWYGKSSAPYQHFGMAVLRAVENRRYVLRAATTGISGIIDPFGRISERTSLHTEAQITATIVPLKIQTLYTRFGWLFPHLSLTLSGVFFILAVIKRKYGKKSKSYR